MKRVKITHKRIAELIVRAYARLGADKKGRTVFPSMVQLSQEVLIRVSRDKWHREDFRDAVQRELFHEYNILMTTVAEDLLLFRFDDALKSPSISDLVCKEVGIPDIGDIYKAERDKHDKLLKSIGWTL